MIYSRACLLALISLFALCKAGSIEVLRTGVKLPVVGSVNARGSLSGILLSKEDACNGKTEPFSLQIKNYKGETGEVPWIALIDEGKCSFSEQLANMKASGAAAVVTKALANKEKTPLPVMMINDVIFKELKRQLALPSTGKITSSAKMQHLAVALHFSPEKPGHSPIHPLLLFFCFLGPTVLVFTALFFWQLFNGGSDDDLFPGESSRFLTPPVPESERPAPLSLVSSLPKRPSTGCPDDVCAVCLDGFGTEEVRQLPCGHEFHLECVDPWLLTKKRKCPVCKGDIVKGSEEERKSLWTRISSLVRNNTEEGDDFQEARQMALESRSNV